MTKPAYHESQLQNSYPEKIQDCALSKSAKYYVCYTVDLNLCVDITMCLLVLCDVFTNEKQQADSTICIYTVIY
jgi:hypothetical protein